MIERNFDIAEGILLDTHSAVDSIFSFHGSLPDLVWV
jgi:hypothetical protein